jgi:membrane peptidoglycan carboxypeptidase
MTLSLNTVFYRLASDVQPAKVAATAHAVGIPATNDGTPTLQINGVTDDRIGIGGYEVRPIDQAVGYATIADGGTTNPAYFVSKVTNSAGTVLYKHSLTSTRSLDPKVANDTALSMEQVASSSQLGLDDNRPVAAKTGTVGIADSLNSSDAWTVGFTPQVSVASWAGSNGTGPIFNNAGTSMYGRQNPGQAWQLFMNAYLKGKPVAPLPTKQEIGVAATPTSTPTTSASSAAPPPSPTTSSSTPTPTPTPTTSSSTPTPTPTPTPTTSTSSPPTSPPPTKTTSSPGGLAVLPNGTRTAAGP